MRAKNKLKEKDRKREKQMEESKMGREVMHRWDRWTDEDGVDGGKQLFVFPPPSKDVALTGALVFVWLTRRCSGAKLNPVLVQCLTSSTLCFYNIEKKQKKKNQDVFLSTCAVDIW